MHGGLAAAHPVYGDAFRCGSGGPRPRGAGRRAAVPVLLWRHVAPLNMCEAVGGPRAGGRQGAAVVAKHALRPKTT